MSEHNKRDKDSYAKDTLAFTVPPEERRRPQNRYPQEQFNQNYYPNGQYPQGDYSYEQYPQGQHYQGQNYPPNQQYPQGQPRPQVQRTQQGQQRPQGQRPPQNQQRPQGQRPPQNQQRSQGQRPQQGQQRPQGQRPPQRQQSAQRKAPANQPKRTQPAKPKPVKQKKHRRTGCLTKILISLLSLLILLFVIYSAISWSLISKVNVVDTGERLTPSHTLYSSSSVRNILLIGSDSRGEDRGRSDSMILLSINSSTNKISLVSLMRDSYVQIPGYGGDKLNAAYSYGGPELLMDTIEENFYIEIDDYFMVNFISFANIVDAVGGVEIEVSDDEADAINVMLDSKEGNTLFGVPDESDYLNGGGTYKLNGKQALCYSRLRYVGNADFERTERQRKVLTEIIKSAGTTNPFKLGKSAKDVLPSMDTNMSKMSMYLLSLRLPSLLIGYDIEQVRIPAEDTYWGSTIDGQSVLEIDIDANLDIIENELY